MVIRMQEFVAKFGIILEKCKSIGRKSIGRNC